MLALFFDLPNASLTREDTANAATLPHLPLCNGMHGIICPLYERTVVQRVPAPLRLNCKTSNGDTCNT